MSKENFQYWKELVGLEPPEFPRLIELDEETIEQAVVVPDRLTRIKSAIAANPLVDIQIQPGWGATTLFRFLQFELGKDPLSLLVCFDFEKDILDGSLTEDAFTFRIKWRMARAICRLFRDRPMEPIYMFEVIGFEDIGASPWQGYLRQLGRKLDACEDSEAEFYKLFPFFSQRPVDVCINYFLSNFQLRTVFLYLFPRKVPDDPLYEFVGMLKNIFDGKDIKPAAKRELYLCTPKLFRKLKETYERPYSNVLYQRYSVAEIFRMLISTYRLDGSSQTLSDVFSENYITAAYSDKLTLNEIMEIVEKSITDELTGNTAQIPYRLGEGKNEEAIR